MESCTVQVKLELGHRAQLRKKVTSEGFTHDWMVFVRGPESSDIQHFVDKVVFRLHESFPKPKRVCKEPPYKVEESGYAGFLMPIEVYFKNKEEPKKVCFNYDLFLNLEGNPPVNHLRCEKLTFNNPTRDFRRKLVKAGGIMVVPEGAEVVPRPSPDYPMLPTIPLSAFSDPKKSKTSQGSKEPSKEGSKVSKSHKMAKEHRERPRKDSESKATSKGDVERDSSSKSSRDPSSSSSSKKTEIKVKDENKVLPKAAFKEPKLTAKESKMEGMSPKGGGAGSVGGGGGGGATDGKAPSKRPSNAESPKPSVKKPKKGGSEGSKVSSSGGLTGTSPRTASSSTASSGYVDKKASKEKGRWAKGKSETQEVKESKKPPQSDDSNSDDEASSKSEQSAPSSPSNSSSSSESSSDSDFEPQQKQGQGRICSFTAGSISLPHFNSRLTVCCFERLPWRGLRTCQIKCLYKLKCDMIIIISFFQAYTEELVDLHRRLMALRERNVLQQIVNLIEETGHFNVTNTTFDFDLFSLDESTVRKLQSYLEATAT
uniref:MLLT1 super elongation complex subunit a n=1 Tax=Cyprinus carpio TaxID=7962 RepID=A0A8C2EYL8_CYPCA